MTTQPAATVRPGQTIFCGRQQLTVEGVLPRLGYGHVIIYAVDAAGRRLEVPLAARESVRVLEGEK